MNSINPQDLSLPKTEKIAVQGTELDDSMPTRIVGERFIKGPITWDWISRACRLPGKAVHVALGVLLLAGITGKKTIQLSQKRLRELGAQRNAAYRGLEALEKEGLVSVERHCGRNSIVKIQEFTKEDRLRN